ncbi:hypothetical protein X739_28210 [Mesorhizobium sp. LNHC220B00]|nr:hypothetical protein X739_28210 [Mesorhizobium sp. LNHC220B00]
MQQPDVRVHPFDDLSIQFKNQAKHAVCGRVLGPKLILKFRTVLSAMQALLGSPPNFSPKPLFH